MDDKQSFSRWPVVHQTGRDLDSTWVHKRDLEHLISALGPPASLLFLSYMDADISDIPFCCCSFSCIMLDKVKVQKSDHHHCWDPCVSYCHTHHPGHCKTPTWNQTSNQDYCKCNAPYLFSVLLICTAIALGFQEAILKAMVTRTQSRQHTWLFFRRSAFSSCESHRFAVSSIKHVLFCNLSVEDRHLINLYISLLWHMSLRKSHSGS